MTDAELDDRLGELLVSSKALDASRVETARVYQQARGGTLAGAVLSLNLATDKVVRMLLEEIAGIKTVDPSLMTVYPDFLERVNTLVPALVGAPDLLVLDEPCVSLDPVARERFLGDVERLVDEGGPTTLVVTHHVEELPRFVTHALLLREGRVVARGAIDLALTSETLSAALGARCTLHRERGRFRLDVQR